jgi:hypothetical protein
MDTWMRSLRDVFLTQLLRREGRGGSAEKLCPVCLDVTKLALFRCQECAGRVLLCRECCVDKHADNPLHVIYVRTVYCSYADGS